ncbi:Bax inhibitor-1/YccA family protein [Brevundimonas sp. 2R-24]|uniref:Bax inhibitor-1/YccA family protein n=1 Tax=Peiella sedimenti TaxID=3061083 RepID=A0ABT8SL57_9CAUL|nr:Bax inhibitor-1/YccA family protein [Caulobacteraceae bacterium XZ-24]
MNDFNRDLAGAPARSEAALDAGLRAFMLGVYNKLALGLAVAAALAWTTAYVPAVRDLMFVTTPDGRLTGFTLLGTIVQWSPLAMLLISMFAMRNPTARGTGLLYWMVVAAFGAGLGVIFLAYSGASIATTFLITAGAFAGLSLFGYTTKMNLGPVRSFLFMGVIGLILASLAFMFLPAVQNPMMYFLINIAGVLIFAGLIAADTQHLKLGYYEAQRRGGESLGVLTNWGALSLFISFMNLFLFLLRLMGGSRN